MIKFKIFNNFNTKKKIALIALLILSLLFILVNYNREIIKSYIGEVVSSPSIRTHIIKIAKVAIPLKNLILMRNFEDKIAILKSSGSCHFCDLSKGSFDESDLRGVDLRYANLFGADLSKTNLNGAKLGHTNIKNANFNGANLVGVNLSNMDLTGTVLTNSNLAGVNLSGVDLSNKDLTGTILTQSNLTEVNLDGVDLRDLDLTGVNLTGVDLSNKDLTGTILTQSNLTEVNLDGVDLRDLDLTGVNLTGVDLSNKDLTGTVLFYSNLTGANLDGVNISNKDLTGANLSRVDLSNKDLTGTILKDAKIIQISISNPTNANWPAINEVKNLNVTRYDLNSDVQYLSTKDGLLFESKNNQSRLVLDLNNDAKFPFNISDSSVETGLLGIASQDGLVYISYTSKDPNGLYSLVVDEYSMAFTKVRNIIKVEGFAEAHFGGKLFFDSLGELYLSVGDGSQFPDQSPAQDIKSMKGQILRLDTSKSKRDPEIIAYGIRNPWGVTIDSQDRVFILACGFANVEAVYLLDDLYTGIPFNLGWPVFEGSTRMRKSSLQFFDVLAPIFETNVRPGCLTAGVYLNDIESFLFADFYGAIRLLKQKENGDWYLLYQYKQEKNIWDFGLDKKTKKIFIAPNNLELEILVDQVKLNQ